jgi:hypothetical protein
VLEEVSAALMKRPLVQKEESEAAEAMERWIAEAVIPNPPDSRPSQV